MRTAEQHWRDVMSACQQRVRRTAWFKMNRALFNTIDYQYRWRLSVSRVVTDE